jgi:hypothetical protein
MSNEHIVIRVRGETYPSARSAARALGFKPHTILRALDKGTLDMVGQYYAGHFDDVYYPSKAAAARAIGVSEQIFTQRIRRGKINWTPAGQK